MSKYYCTQHPISLGTFPSGHKVTGIVNFDDHTYIEEIGEMAWGWIEFADDLGENEARNYELVKAED